MFLRAIRDEAKDLLGDSSVDLKHRLSTAEFLEGYGFGVLNPIDIAKSKERAEVLFELAALLTANNEDHGIRECWGKSRISWKKRRRTTGRDGIEMDSYSQRS